MLKKLFLSCAALVAAFAGAPAIAQTAAPAPAPAAATQDATPALWVVKDKDTTIYLFGSVHVLKPGLNWFKGRVKQAFDSSDQLMLEMVEPDPATLQGIVMRVAVRPTGPTVTELLPEGKRQAYRDAMTGIGIAPEMLDHFDPWFPAIALSTAPLAKLGYDPNSGVEKVLTAAAKAANKPIGGLETPEQQIGYFDGLPEPLQVQFLVSTVDELPKMGDSLDKMVGFWAKGDPESLGVQMNESMRETPEIARVLLSERNERWAGWIANRLGQPGTVFIAVGAGHLAGPDSVQAYLAKRGITAERVRY